MTGKTQKSLSAILILIIVAFIAYEYLYAAPPAPSADSTAVGADVLSLAGKIGTISLDQSLFSNPLFAGLKDDSAPLSPEAQGRDNPFAPIGQ